jgi:hypothetical protein
VYPLYAAAGDCDISKGQKVGNLIITNTTVTYVLLDGFKMSRANLYVGQEQYPLGPGRRTAVPWPFQKSFACPTESTNFPGLNITMDMFIIAQADICGYYSLPATSKLLAQAAGSSISGSSAGNDWAMDNLSSSSSSSSSNEAADYVSSQIWKDLSTQVMQALHTQSSQTPGGGMSSGLPSKAEVIESTEATAAGGVNAGGLTTAATGFGGGQHDKADIIQSWQSIAAGGGASTGAVTAAAASQGDVAAVGATGSGSGDLVKVEMMQRWQAGATAASKIAAGARAGGELAAGVGGTGGAPAAGTSNHPAVVAAAGGESATGNIEGAGGKAGAAANGGGMLLTSRISVAVSSSSSSSRMQPAPLAGGSSQSSIGPSSLPVGEPGVAAKGGLGELYTLNHPGKAAVLVTPSSSVPNGDPPMQASPAAAPAVAAAGGSGGGEDQQVDGTRGDRVKMEAVIPDDTSSGLKSNISQKYEVMGRGNGVGGGPLHHTQAAPGGGTGSAGGAGIGAAAAVAGVTRLQVDYFDTGQTPTGAAGPAAGAGPGALTSAAAAEGSAPGQATDYDTVKLETLVQQSTLSAVAGGRTAAETPGAAAAGVAGEGGAGISQSQVNHPDGGQRGSQPGAAAGVGVLPTAAAAGSRPSWNSSGYDSDQASSPMQSGVVARPEAPEVPSNVISTPGSWGDQGAIISIAGPGSQPAATASREDPGAPVGSNPVLDAPLPHTGAVDVEESYVNDYLGPALEGDDTFLSDEYLGTLDDFMRHYADHGHGGGHFIGEGKRKLARAADAVEPT